MRPVRPRHRQHLMLAGINQSVFLQEWGFPEAELYLDRIQGLFKRDATFMEARSTDTEEDHYTMWVYRKRNKVLFFIRGTMVSHLSCTEFKERQKNRTLKPHFEVPGKASAISASALSLVA